MVRPEDPELKELLKHFVCVKRTSMHDVNLEVFAFDYDLTWWAFLIDAHERVYSRFGGSGDADPASRLSVAGLKYTMRLVLQEHERRRNELPPPPVAVRRPVDLFGMKGKCMHCHHVNENFYKRETPKPRITDLDRLRFLPVPEDVGLTLMIDAGNRIERVIEASPADKAGLRPGDIVWQVGSVPTRSQGDVMWALKLAPKEGRLALVFERNAKRRETSLELAGGWKKPDLSWRRSVSKLKK
ncbi:MAG: PDZ domain-containing protein [Gemmataceae bacterium]|nr:PDZ domain-containing protein [Gemmataceae bacterium]